MVQNSCLLLTVIGTMVLSACDKTPKFEILFDDFNYESSEQFSNNGWKIRTQTGHPGVKNANWSQDGISFHIEGEGAQNGFIRMTSFTDGTAENTQHTQFCHARKYREGTYAARVFFRNQPNVGPDGDEVIQTFYAISPLKAPMDLDYSEADFEYLPNGGWGGEPLSMWATSWETFQLEPWTKVNEFSTDVGSLQGWHTLVMQIANDEIVYSVDGKEFGRHSKNVYPEVPMSINFNMWFTPEGAIDSNEYREYREDIDWVFHIVNAVMTTDEVLTKVEQLRHDKVLFIDNVNAKTPPLASPCGL